MFRKKTFYPPKIAETILGLSGKDVMWMFQNLRPGMDIENMPTGETGIFDAWSEYMKALFGIHLSYVDPGLRKGFEHLLQDATVVRLKSSENVDDLEKLVSNKQWFEGAAEYSRLSDGEIVKKLLKELIKAFPWELSSNEESVLENYLTRHLPQIHDELKKHKFSIRIEDN